MKQKKIYAFPNERCFGMTLREYYAGLAMQSYCTRDVEKGWKKEEIASDAFEMADEMIAIIELGE
jgi:hypothetical protein